MTVIVGIKSKKGVYLGCDSQGSNGWDKTQRKDAKIFVAHGIGYGFTTSYRMGQILRYHSTEVLNGMRASDLYGYVVTCLVPMYRDILGAHGFKKTRDGSEEGGTFLLAIDGSLFKVDSDFQVAECVNNYDAVGCGSSYALGAMYNQKETEPVISRIINAVETAINFSNGCGGEVVTLCVP